MKLLDEGYNILQGFKYESIGITFEYLEAVAKIRYVCYKVAKLLTQQHDDSDHSKQQLIKRVQVICQDKTINTIDIGPGIFLVKQIAREYDQTTFDELSINEKTKWIIPDCLKIMKDEVLLNNKINIFCFAIMIVYNTLIMLSLIYLFYTHIVKSTVS